MTDTFGSDLLWTTDSSGNNLRALYNDSAFNHDINPGPKNPAVSENHIYWIMPDSNTAEGESTHLFKMPKSGDQTPVKINTGFRVVCLHIHRNEGTCK